MLLASATALFKPGLQGTIGRSLREGHASFGWGLFYLMANTGGFLGPWAAGCLRLLAWRYVFFMSAAAVLANLLVLLAYDEPQAAAAPPPRAGENLRILLSSLRGLREPRLLAFLLLFSGYWVMFMQLFDILPNFIDDWVDSSALVGLAGRLLGVRRLVEASAAGRCIPPEWLINLNSALIILLMIPVSTLTARVSVPSSIAAGTLLASAGMILAGSSMNAWLCVAGIAVFSLGEMAAGPKLPEYLCALAPPEKKGLYMGYASLPLAVGWALGSRLGGFLYENCADKTRFARGLLVTDFGVSPEAASALAKGAVLPELAARMGSTQEQATRELFLRLKPWRIWPAFALIALASAAGLALYERRYGGRASGRRVC
jgi:dipeptide/tripeptide permease